MSKDELKQALKELFQSGDITINASLDDMGYRRGYSLNLDVNIDNEKVYRSEGWVDIKNPDYE